MNQYQREVYDGIMPQQQLEKVLLEVFVVVLRVRCLLLSW
jgi:hypothetical protein